MGMQENLGSGRFHRIYYRHERAYVMSLPDQRIYVWFPPGKETMMLLDVITRFVPDATAEKVFDSLIDYQHEGHP
jgi:hypothetical protein